MKKNTLLNSQISYVIAALGHAEQITICDAGLPISNNEQRIDLALSKNIPTFIDTVKATLAEMCIEAIILAKEFKTISPQVHDELIAIIKAEEELYAKSIAISYISHQEFKMKTHNSKAIIRTGEFTPYANVIFQSDVVF